MAGFVDVQLEAATLQGVTLGDRQALAAVYGELAAPVLTLATRILQDRAQAQEVLQDTFVDLIERGQQIREAAAVVGWVRKVAVNHCLMRLRSPWHQRRAVGLLPEVAADGLEPQDQAASTFSGATRDNGSLAENLPDISQALAKLGPETRFVVWLHDVEGYTHKEIGVMLERTTSYSKSQLARGYEQLARLYQTQPVAGPPHLVSVDPEQPVDQQGSVKQEKPCQTK